MQISDERTEIDRITSLRAYEILDTEPDANFDAIVRLASQALNVSTAAISFIDQKRQWIKSSSGMFAAGDEQSRDVSFCNFAIQSPHEMFVVADASHDPRFASNPLVLQPGGIRFYAAVPLLDNANRAIGTFCIIDEAPRVLSNEELDMLRDFSTAVDAAIALHLQAVETHVNGERRRTAIELNPKIPWTSNPDGHILEVSPSLVITLATGNAQSLVAPDWTQLIHPDDLRDAQRLREDAIEKGEPYDIEHRMRSADGSWRWFRSFAAPRRNEQGEIILWFGSSEDITERKISQQQVIHMAYHDGLTGLPNRVKFSILLEDRIKRTRNTASSFALLCLDLDHFKGINDRVGHPGGDDVLKQIAERLGRCMQPTNVLARFGSDEFFIIHPCQSDEVMVMANRVSSALSEPLFVEGHFLNITASIGVAHYPQDGADSDGLFRNADLALHRAKTIGSSNCCLFDKVLDESRSRIVGLKMDLQSAIDRNEFELAYQPILNLQTGRINGFEALLRWRHPLLEWVSPAEFIPCAEESGQIIAIGEWVTNRACQDAASWPDDVSVSVNLSPVQFGDRDLLAMITAALEDSGLPSRRLELEITESVLMSDNDKNLVLLGSLRDAGVRFALDDFGTGYSSLNYLQRFPFDKLKIDRSVVNRMAEGIEGRAVVRAVIAMGRALGMSITAEGIEDQKQLDDLRVEGCDQVQGYLISRPVPIGEVLPLIHRLNGMTKISEAVQNLA
jgi:diguanylate cyclase (GGDEF)-like protein/PAS domain S-box-containing protein